MLPKDHIEEYYSILPTRKPVSGYIIRFSFLTATIDGLLTTSMQDIQVKKSTSYRLFVPVQIALEQLAYFGMDSDRIGRICFIVSLRGREF